MPVWLRHVSHREREREIRKEKNFIYCLLTNSQAAGLLVGLVGQLYGADGSYDTRQIKDFQLP